MALPKLPRKRPRNIALSVRLSETSMAQLRTLAAHHNLSQADVVECLLEAEFGEFRPKSAVARLKGRPPIKRERHG